MGHNTVYYIQLMPDVRVDFSIIYILCIYTYQQSLNDIWCRKALPSLTCSVTYDN